MQTAGASVGERPGGGSIPTGDATGAGGSAGWNRPS